MIFLRTEEIAEGTSECTIWDESSPSSHLVLWRLDCWIPENLAVAMSQQAESLTVEY